MSVTTVYSERSRILLPVQLVYNKVCSPKHHIEPFPTSVSVQVESHWKSFQVVHHCICLRQPETGQQLTHKVNNNKRLQSQMQSSNTTSLRLFRQLNAAKEPHQDDTPHFGKDAMCTSLALQKARNTTHLGHRTSVSRVMPGAFQSKHHSSKLTVYGLA